MESKLVLDISYLDEIIRLLRHYSAVDYEVDYDCYKLGRHLGLSSDTLDDIREKNDVSSFPRECLTAWLQQADDVKNKGVPTYNTLIQALRKMGENAVADGIDREKHPACVIFTQCESNEAVVDALPCLAILLFKEKIIDEKLLVFPTTGEALLKAVKEAICADYRNLEKFAEILTELQDKSIGQSLLIKYKKFFSVIRTVITGEKVKINYPIELCAEFTRICLKFTELKVTVAKAMEKKVKIEDLKKYCCENKTHLKSLVASCMKIEELVQLIDVTLLQDTIEQFKVEEVKPAVQEYQKEIEKLYRKRRPLKEFLCKNQGFAASPLLHYKTATIFVHESMDNFELAYILMTINFQRMELGEVNLEFVDESNSFKITLSFPAVLSDSLIATACGNIDSLIERGVKKLTIGYSTVYDHEIHGTITSKQHIEKQLYALVYRSQGTMEQLLISRAIQLLNSEEELASIQKWKDELKEAIHASEKMWETFPKEMEHIKKLKKLQEKIQKENETLFPKLMQENETEKLAEFQIRRLFYYMYLLDTELQKVIKMQQGNTQTPVPNYLLKVYYQTKTPGKEWLMRVFFGRLEDSDALNKHIDKTYSNLEEGVRIPFTFENNDGFIELCFERQCPRGWSVRSHQDPTRVSRTAIDQQKSNVVFTITATPGEGTVKELCYPVTLQGIKCDAEKINIVRTMGAATSLGGPPTTMQHINASGQFRRISNRLGGSISSCLITVSMSLNARCLIAQELCDEMVEGRATNDKAAKLVNKIQKTLNSEPNPEVYLNDVCSALKDVGEEQITHIVNELERSVN